MLLHIIAVNNDSEILWLSFNCHLIFISTRDSQSAADVYYSFKTTTTLVNNVFSLQKARNSDPCYFACCWRAVEQIAKMSTNWEALTPCDTPVIIFILWRTTLYRNMAPDNKKVFYIKRLFHQRSTLLFKEIHPFQLHLYASGNWLLVDLQVYRAMLSTEPILTHIHDNMRSKRFRIFFKCNLFRLRMSPAIFVILFMPHKLINWGREKHIGVSKLGHHWFI